MNLYLLRGRIAAFPAFNMERKGINEKSLDTEASGEEEGNKKEGHHVNDKKGDDKEKKAKVEGDREITQEDTHEENNKEESDKQEKGGKVWVLSKTKDQWVESSEAKSEDAA